MESIVRGISHVAVYLEDIILTSWIDMEHRGIVSKDKDWIEWSGLCLKWVRCKFIQLETYLRHRMTSKGFVKSWGDENLSLWKIFWEKEKKKAGKV